MSNRNKIVNKLQERIQELVEKREKINQEIDFIQSIIAELCRENYSSSSELSSNDDISIEFIPKRKEEKKGQLKKDKKISSRKAERQEGLE
jgi:hypothetical protein